MSDDHASHAISAYGSRINKTPRIDQLAAGGMRFDACFCTNSICTPSRAAVLTGTYNHVNGVTTLDTPMDNRLVTFPKLFQEAGYQTAIFGKWHLGHGSAHDPTGFDDWLVLPDQGDYHDPTFLGPEGSTRLNGYATDIITDLSLTWIDQRDPRRPFLLLCHHKAPHRPWEPDDAHASMYEYETIPEPESFWDDHATRSAAAAAARMRMMDLTATDLKAEVPAGLSQEEEISWRYQRYIKDYLRVVASIDDNVGRMLDYLDDNRLTDDTIVIYTSDQGFFLGEHGWFDKRFMYEESLAMPLLVRGPGVTAPGSTCDEMVLNVDFAPTLLDLAGIGAPDEMQGRSFRPLLEGSTPPDWPQAMYYRYWMHLDDAHNVPAHFGIRTKRHKLIFFDQGDQEWELYDLAADPFEMNNIYHENRDLVADLKGELIRLQKQVGDHAGFSI